MTLYDYLKMQNNGYLSVDTYDKDYDAVVTIDVEIEDEGKKGILHDDDENYYKFIFALLRVVEVISFDRGNVICDWSGLVENNMTIFREFSKEHWNSQYEDDDEEFIYQWINELHMYYAGYVGESTYKAFREDVLEKIGEKNNA